jgi:phage shock protein C
MSLSAELEKLDELRRRGALSAEEFSRAKARVLTSSGHAAANPVVDGVNALRRSRSERWLGGVCGGLAQTFGSVAWIWRLAFTLFVLCAGTGILIYLLMWLLVPLESAAVGGSTPAAAHPA